MLIYQLIQKLKLSGNEPTMYEADVLELKA